MWLIPIILTLFSGLLHASLHNQELSLSVRYKQIRETFKESFTAHDKKMSTMQVHRLIEHRFLNQYADELRWIDLIVHQSSPAYAPLIFFLRRLNKVSIKETNAGLVFENFSMCDLPVMEECLPLLINQELIKQYMPKNFIDRKAENDIIEKIEKLTSREIYSLARFTQLFPAFSEKTGEIIGLAVTRKLIGEALASQAAHKPINS